MYMHSLCVAYPRTPTACPLKIKEELLNMFLWKHRMKKKSLEDQTHFCLHELRKHWNTRKIDGKVCIPVRQKKKQKNILSSEEVWAHDKLHTMHSLRNNSSDPLYQLPILLLVLLEAYVWEHRQAEQADADRDKNVHSSATNVSLHAFLH